MMVWKGENYLDRLRDRLLNTLMHQKILCHYVLTIPRKKCFLVVCFELSMAKFRNIDFDHVTSKMCLLRLLFYPGVVQST